MTTTLSERGQVLIPKEIRDLHRWRKGDDLLILARPNGEVVLRRVRTNPRRTLLENLRALRGLEIPV